MTHRLWPLPYKYWATEKMLFAALNKQQFSTKKPINSQIYLHKNLEHSRSLKESIAYNQALSVTNYEFEAHINPNKQTCD